MLAVLGLLLASHGAMWYKLGRLEARLDAWFQINKKGD